MSTTFPRIHATILGHPPRKNLRKVVDISGQVWYGLFMDNEDQHDRHLRWKRERPETLREAEARLIRQHPSWSFLDVARVLKDTGR